MKIYTADNQLFLEVEVTEGYRFKQIMGENRLYLNFSLDYYTEVPLGAWCIFNNEKYFLLDAQEPTKNNTQNFDYKLSFDTYIAYLKTQVFEFVVIEYDEYGLPEQAYWEVKPGFSLTGTPDRFLQLLVDNMNEKDKEGGWKVGEYVESNELLIDFNNNFCYEVLGMLADKFETEWEVEGKTIHLRKVEKMKDSAIALAYGMNKGLLSGITRTNYQSAIGRIIVKTSDRNIDQSTYGSQTLKMPKNKSIVYEGVEYVTDITGTKIQRKTPIIKGNILPEEILDLTKIYPRRVGTVSKVTAVNDTQGLYDFYDNTIPDSLNFKNMIIPGETMIVVFQTGQLAGQGGESGLTVDYNHADRKFLIKPNTDNGLIVPQGTLIPAIGDKYAVFHIMLPQQYIDDAQNEAMNEAVKKLYMREQVEYTYKATLSELYSKRNWGAIGGLLNIGNFVKLSVPEFFEGTEDIRIISVKEYLDKPKQPVIELSNSVTGRSEYSSAISQVQTQEQTNSRIKKDLINYAKRGWSDTQELIGAVKAMVDDFENSELSADVLKGMVGLFGSESLQFQFLDTNWTTAITPFISFNPDTKQLSCRSARVQHMTLGIETLQPGRSVLDYKFWSAPDYISPVLTESSKPYFLYLKASKTFQETGGRNVGEAIFFISTDKIKLDDVEGYYTLWVGYLNSENMEGDRSFRTMYGYTEVLPGQITVDKLLSTSGALVIDLLNGVITAKDGATIQGNVKFLSNGSYKDIADELKNTNDKVENIHIGGRNYVLGSKELSHGGSTSVYTFATLKLSEGLQPNTQYTLSVGKSEILSGTAVPTYSVVIYNTSTNKGGSAFTLPISTGRQSYTFNTGNLPNSGYTLLLYTGLSGSSANRAMKWSEVQLEKSNKVGDWNLAPEDVQNKINEVKNDANNAQSTANTASQNVSNLNAYVDGAFKDGVIDNAEAKAIEKYLNTLDETMSQVEATYNKLYVNSYLEGIPKTSLLNAKVNLFGARDALRKSINTAIADGKTTVSEKADVDNKFSTFNTSLKAFQNAVEDANKSIQNKLDSLSTDKINNIQIGGRNYVLGSKELKHGGSSSIYTFTTLTLSEGLQSNTQYTLSVGKSEILSGSTVPSYSVVIYNMTTNQGGSAFTLPISANKQSYTFNTGNLPNSGYTLLLYTGLSGSSANRAMKWTEVNLEKANKASGWSLAPEDTLKGIEEAKAKAEALAYLQTALQNRTEIDGGLLLTSLLKLGTFSGNTFTDKAGINGTASSANDVVAWFGGSLQQAIQNLASIVFRMDGSGQLAKGNIGWDTNGDTLVKGQFESNSDGNRIIIDPSSRVMKMINKDNQEIMIFEFNASPNGVVVPKITCKTYLPNNVLYMVTTISGGGITCYSELDSDLIAITPGYLVIRDKNQTGNNSLCMYRNANNTVEIEAKLRTTKPAYPNVFYRNGNQVLIS